MLAKMENGEKGWKRLEDFVGLVFGFSINHPKNTMFSYALPDNKMIMDVCIKPRSKS